MQRQKLSRAAPFWLVAAGLLVLPALGGCAQHVYTASKLPLEFAAPGSIDLQTINLSGLTGRSVSVEVIQPGDVLEVTMVTDYTKLTTTTTPVRVADDGSVMVPLVGRVSVAGFSVEQAEQRLGAESVMRGVFRTPCINLCMKQCRTNKVSIVGAVNKPGMHELPRGSSSLMAALVAADGLSKEAGTEVEIRHTDSRQALAAGAQPPSPYSVPGAEGTVAPTAYQQWPGAEMPAVTKVDLLSATSGVEKAPELRDGDVVYVAKRTLRPVYVIGLVRKPGEFPYPTNQEIRVLDALALAGGCSNAVAEDVMVIRQLPGQPEPIRIAVSIQAAKNGRDNLALAPGDTVTVEQSAATVAVDVVQTFFRVAVGANVSWF
jgi:polysaccharide biosynthesis/export protein